MKTLVSILVLFLALLIALVVCAGACWVSARLGFNQIALIAAAIITPMLYGILKQG